MKNKSTVSEIERILYDAHTQLSDRDKIYLQRHFREQLKQAYVHGIIDGPDGNFNNYYEQKYGTPIKLDDHFGI
jgi:hypothetical protein